MTSKIDIKTIDKFHKLYYAKKSQTWGDTKWLGTPLLKCPLDLWVYQQILFEVRPDFIIETGTWFGGTAHYLASLCELMGQGQIITIDNNPRENCPAHPRIQYLVGSSTSSQIIHQVIDYLKPEAKVMVILDSDHHMNHVLQEMRLYSTYVSQGSYLIVEDTNLNGHPVEPDFGPGPREAIDQFLGENHSFTIDLQRELFLITANAGGYLRRITP